MLCTVTLLVRWRPSKIYITSFNVARRNMVFDEPSPGAPITDTMEDNVKKNPRSRIDRPPIEGARDS